MATFKKFNCFVDDLCKGVHNLVAAGNVVKAYATNVVPSASSHVKKADLAEITAVNGYPSGGTDIQNDYVTSGGVGVFTGVDIDWTATGGSFGPFRFIVLYNDTAADDPLIAYWDVGSSQTVLEGNTFTVDFGDYIFILS